MNIDFFVVYDVASGEALRMGQVPGGQAVLQRAALAQGQDLMLVPAQAMMGMEFDLEPVRAALLLGLEEGLGAAIGFHPARDYLYLQKEAAARAVLDGSGYGSLLEQEAEVRAMSVQDLAQAIVEAAEARRSELGAIEARRTAIKMQVVAASKIGELAAASKDIAVLAARA